MGEPVVFRASNLGACTKALVADRLGFKALPPPADFEVYFQRGHDHEAECAEQMHAQGFLLTNQQNECSIEIADGIRVVGHIDGTVHPYDNLWARPRVWEAKAPNAWESYERAHKTGVHTPLTARYAWQSSVYMVALGLEQMVSCWDGERVRSFVIEVPPYSREQIIDRVLAIEAQAKLGLPECCDQRDYPCGWHYLHTDTERDFDDDAELDALALELVEIRARRATDKATEDALRDKIRTSMGERTHVDTAHARLTVCESTRTRVDVDAAEQAGIDLTPYRVSAVSTGLKVTPKKEADQ